MGQCQAPEDPVLKHSHRRKLSFPPDGERILLIKLVGLFVIATWHSLMCPVMIDSHHPAKLGQAKSLCVIGKPVHHTPLVTVCVGRARHVPSVPPCIGWWPASTLAAVCAAGKGEWEQEQAT